jgi:hypothetical protein
MQNFKPKDNPFWENLDEGSRYSSSCSCYDVKVKSAPGLALDVS